MYVAEMEAGGYIFKKKPSGNTMKYAMTIQNVIDLYNRKVPKYRDPLIKPLRFLYVILKVVVSRQFLPLHYHMLFELILSFVRRPTYSGHRFRSAGISDNVPEP